MYYFNTKYSLIFVLKIQKEFHCFLKGDCAKNYATLFVKSMLTHILFCYFIFLLSIFAILQNEFLAFFSRF